MANTKNYTEHGGSVTHIGGELVLDPGSKVIKDGQEIDIGGSLPSVEGSGKVLVSVNGEWEEQDGYGYTEKGDQTVITWDGDVAGKVVVNERYYLVSDKVFSWDDLIGGKLVTSDGDITELTEELINSVRDVVISDNVIYVDYVICATEDNASASIEGNTLTLPLKGVYFLKYNAGSPYVSSLTYGTPDAVHKIDSKYLPSGGVMVVNFTVDEEAGGFTADKTPEEINSAFNQGIFVYGIVMGSMQLTLVAAGEVVQFDACAIISDDAVAFTSLRWNSDLELWDYKSKTMVFD